MMVESERPHRSKSSSGTTSELFICFSTSRLSSSSSMKLSSKSLLSPGRTRDQTPQISLSSSLSRRLRTSSSIKGGASPMFPSGSGGGGSKKRGGFENPEPSSPKVTCIGQVRVKTKKQGKKMRMISSRSKRSRSGSGVGGAEASFRKAEQSVNQHESFQALHFPTHQMSSSSQRECLRQRNNQRWVHLPLTICEALRAFGSEFNCLIPNKSSCLSGGEAKKDEENKGVRSESGNSSCGAVFARWFVALGDGEDGNKRREIELVVGEEEEEEERTEMSSGSHSLRRQIFEGIEFKEEIVSEALMREEEEGRVSMCVPPKNALLLMRCRSDPVKMAALGNRFWEMPAAPKEEVSEDEDEDEGLEEKEKPHEEKEKGQIGLQTDVKLFGDDGMCEKWVLDGEDVEEQEEKEEELSLVLEDEKPEQSESLYEQPEVVVEGKECREEEPDREENTNEPALVEEAVLDCSLAEFFADPEMSEVEEMGLQFEEAHEEQREEEMREVELSISEEVLYKQEEEEEEEEAESWAETEAEVTEDSTAEEEKESRESTREEAEESRAIVTQDRPEPESERPKAQTDLQPKPSSQNQVLPDCLLLMMCEPKLSMEVSKETWVCSTDFIRCLPERHVSSNKKDGKDEAKKPPRVSIASKPAAVQQQPMIQPPRSSCSFPIQAGGGPVSMAEIIGQKLVGSNAYEPFVLTRCKSEPMRSAAKLAPEACFWKNRKHEPHRHPGPLGVGATGVGF
ncbi:hypothetical protein RchiOBHm_Chr5g0032241 [Rosa chinensis]|uniref:Uncharacterized protein n=1 Tax=Rosa chinensis TaxID=74649 RepID=A0A2P6QAF8_ROSCH|nr:histone acetyltransferase KAT6B [Rosa chinensis]PRQ31143.1 hypothetical protein RchiOBHm_Chr5g0032241 [Rosa chinensis]